LRASHRRSSRLRAAAPSRPGHSGPTADLTALTALGSRPALIEAGAAASLSQERRDRVCSLIGLTVKLGLVAMAGVSLVRLAVAYQERMDRQGELAAVLELEESKLARARERFDALFSVGGEERLIREQDQWIAPNRLRVVWKQPPAGSDGAQAGEAPAAQAGPEASP
jgi:hypothetical protein